MLARTNIPTLATRNEVTPFLTQFDRPVDNDHPWNAVIAPSKDWIIAPDMYLPMQGKAVKIVGDSKPVPVDIDLDDVCFTNFAPQAMIRSWEIHLNQVDMTQNHGQNPYVALFTSGLEFTPQQREALFARSCYYLDEPDQHNNFKGPEDVPSGTEPTDSAFVKRRSELAAPTFDWYTPVMADIFLQNQSFPDNVRMEMKVELNDPRFYINGNVPPNTRYEVIMSKVELCYRRMKIAKPLTDYTSAKELTYPYKRFEHRFYTVSQEVATIDIELLEGVLPDKMHLFATTQNAFNGSYKENAFRFIHCNTKSMFLEIDGVHCVPPVAYELEKTTTDKGRKRKRQEPSRKRRNVEPIPESRPATPEEPEPKRRRDVDATATDEVEFSQSARFFMESNMATKDHPWDPTNTPVNYENFLKGYFCPSFDLRNDRQPTEAQKVEKQAIGTVRLRWQLYQTLKKPVVLHVLMERNKAFGIKSNGEVRHIS